MGDAAEKYEIVRMPRDEKELASVLEEVSPFVDATYSEEDQAVFGEPRFLLDYWLFVWDTGSGFFVTKRDGEGKLMLVAMLTKYKDIWYARTRLEIQRISIAEGVEDEDKEIKALEEYLISVAPLMEFDFLYRNIRDDKGNELKKLVWRS